MSVTNDLPTGSHVITVAAAAALTSRFRTNCEALLDSSYRSQDILPYSETFNRAAIDTLLAKSGAEGLRVYFGLDSNYKLHAVLVAVNDSNEDILTPLHSRTSGDEDVMEEGQRCPDLCPPSSELNS